LSSHPSLFSHSPPAPRASHSLPTRRSSDLQRLTRAPRPDAHNAPPVGEPTRGIAACTSVRNMADHALLCAETCRRRSPWWAPRRSEEHTSELQSLTNLVCPLLLEKKKALYP